MQLSKDDHLLDIGCGWGELARYFAGAYGCKITAVNISRPQSEHAGKICDGLPMSFHDDDYREISGRFDKIVSVGMFEHVGRRNYRTFMEVVHRNLKQDGIFLLHTIGSNVSRANCDPWINKYILKKGIISVCVPNWSHTIKNRDHKMVFFSNPLPMQVFNGN